MSASFCREYWTIGDNRFGQQMNGSTCPVRKLQPVTTLSKNLHVRDIVSGHNGSVYILCSTSSDDACADLVVCGQNEVGELGVVDTMIIYILMSWTHANESTRTGAQINVPTDVIVLIVKFVSKHIPDCMSCIKLPITLYALRVTHVSQGIAASHKFIITDKNQIFGFGSNTSRQLETTIDRGSQKEHTFTPISYFAQNKISIVQIACMAHSSVFLSASGEVFKMGDVCWRNHYPKYFSTQVIRGMVKIESEDGVKFKQVACGYIHTVLLGVDGWVYTFGRNTHGQLGNNTPLGNASSSDSITPTRIVMSVSVMPSMHTDFEIVQISCGALHTVVLDMNGNVYMFGDNNYHQIGNAGARKIPQFLAIQNETLKEKKVVDVKCGYYHNVAKTDTNEYYLWGSNGDYECLVFEDNNPDDDLEFVSAPTRFEMKDTEIIDIFPGFYSTTVVCKNPSLL